MKGKGEGKKTRGEEGKRGAGEGNGTGVGEIVVGRFEGQF